MTSTSKRASLFIKAYLMEFEKMLTPFPGEARSLFPRFTETPHRVAIYLSRKKGIAFWVKREARRWTFVVSHSDKRIEEAVGFPRNGQPALHVDNANEVKLANLNILLGGVGDLGNQTNAASLVLPSNFSVLAVGGDSDVQFFDMVFGWTEAGHPMIVNPAFLWILTYTSRPPLSPRLAHARAKRDASFFIVQSAFGLDPNAVPRSALEKILEWLQQTQEEYLFLVRRTDTEEEEIQVHLKRKPFFLDPWASSVIPKYRVGDFVTDFVIRYPDQSFRLVELERPHDTIIVDDQLSDRAAHAVGQVRDWTNHLRKHPDPALATPTPCHWVIIGLRERLTAPEQTKLASINHGLEDIEVRTFDDLAQNLQSRATDLVRVLSQKSDGHDP